LDAENETKHEDEDNLIDSKEDSSEDDWLHGLSLDPEGKRPPPCWTFAKQGKCEFGDKCKFSHHPDDVKRYNAARTLGQASMKSVAANKTATWFPQQVKGAGSSPGVRPKVFTPTSILKPGPDGASRKV